MTALLLALLVAGSPDWYDSYQRGVGAARDGRYEDAVRLLSEAIETKPEESDVVRRDDKTKVRYHPYYYRGYSYLKSGEKKKAADDLARANGSGDVDLGALPELREEAGNVTSEASPQPRRTRPVAASATAAGASFAAAIPYINEHSTPSYAVGWFTLALINAGLAQGKRRRGFVWFLLSLLLGPIATFLIVALAPAAPRG